MAILDCPKEPVNLSFRSILSIRPFRNLWLGQAISQLGDAFYYVIFMFMVKKVTGSNAMVGYVGALEAIPYLIFGPYSGVLADRIDRKKIMLFSDLGSGLVLTGFGLVIGMGITPPSWLIMGLAFTLSSMRCFFMPAKSAAIPALVSEENVLVANALSATTQNFMPVIGLSFSASVLSVLYTAQPTLFFLCSVLLNAASFFLSAFFIFSLPAILPVRKEEAHTHPWVDFKDGIQYVRHRHDLSVLILILTFFRLMVAPFFVMYIAANDLWFGGKPQTLAWCEVSFFVGMILTSSLMGKAKVQRPALWLCTGLAVTGISVAAMAFVPQFSWFVLWNFIAGLAVPAADVPMNTFMQVSVPDSYRGRTNSVLNMIATAAMPLGMSMGGIMEERLGLSTSFLIMGVGMAAACVIGALDRPFRSVRMPA